MDLNWLMYLKLIIEISVPDRLIDFFKSFKSFGRIFSLRQGALFVLFRRDRLPFRVKLEAVLWKFWASF